MFFKIGLDLGYGFIKGVNDSNIQIKYPSLISQDLMNNDNKLIENIFSEHASKSFSQTDIAEIEDDLRICIMDNKRPRYFYVGSTAKNRTNATFLMDNNKIDSIETKVLLSAAAALLSPKTDKADKKIYLVTGLPINQYKMQAKQLRKMLYNYNYVVTIPKYHISQKIKFDRVDIVPQGVGAVYNSIWKDFSKYVVPNSCIGFIDWGYKTIDYLVFSVDSDGVPRPLPQFCDSIDNGMYFINEDLNKIFKASHGEALSIDNTAKLIAGEEIWYKGSELSMVEEVNSIKKDRARKAESIIKAEWQSIISNMRTLFIGGGGGKDMYRYLDFNEFNTSIKLVDNPQMGNAYGYKEIAAVREKQM